MNLDSKEETKRTLSPLTLPIKSGLRGEGERPARRKML